MHTNSSTQNLARAFKIFAVAVGALYVVVVTLFIVGYFANQHRIAQQEKDRMERVQAFNLINKEQCQEIEKLKLQFREDAIKDYNRLDETLAFLKLERTPAIEKRAKGDRDEVLERFKKDTCPRREIK